MKYFVTCWIGRIACMMALFGTTALAAENPSAWPSRPVKIIIPFSPGGGTDNL
jgi:tripartite-type tricarboxylate transporter receptor subunit TctC